MISRASARAPKLSKMLLLVTPNGTINTMLTLHFIVIQSNSQPKENASLMVEFSDTIKTPPCPIMESSECGDSPATTKLSQLEQRQHNLLQELKATSTQLLKKFSSIEPYTLKSHLLCHKEPRETEHASLVWTS